MGIQLPGTVRPLQHQPDFQPSQWPWGVFNLFKILISAKAGASLCWLWDEPLLLLGPSHSSSAGRASPCEAAGSV